VIARRRRERARADADALWLDAMRIAEQVGGLEVSLDPVLAGRVTQVCRGALADAFEALWARNPAEAKPAIREAMAVIGEWARLRHRLCESERRPAPPSAAAHVLVAPSLAELTVANMRDDAVDLADLHAAAELASQRTLLQLAGCLAAGGRCQLTVDQLLELHDSDLRYALEAVAWHRGLWPVMSDLRWLQAAQALRATEGGPHDRR
jgi:hypothetical protein